MLRILDEAFLMGTKSMFYGKLENLYPKIITKYSSLTSPLNKTPGAMVWQKQRKENALTDL